MQTRYRAASSWWVAIWIYVVTFFLVTLTFFQAANSKSLESKAKRAANKEQTDSAKKEKGNSMLVIMETSEGSIKIKLNAEKAPKSVDNFLKYVDEGFYNGVIFHRVIPGFMIQGGGFTPDMGQKKTHESIKNEANNGLLNKRGTLAMARTNDPHSASAQFFINLVDNNFLNFRAENMQGWGYAVFGEVIEGMDVVDKIATTKTGNKMGYDDVPATPILIKSAKRL
jgi:peptidyl-prolyl cis-trans isomerase B (cyclophilin B)